MIVDAHEDIAWAALAYGRAYTRSVAAIRAAERDTDIPGRNGIAMLGWPDWAEGDVGVVFATLFAVPLRHRFDEQSDKHYSTVPQAHSLYVENLRYYEALCDEHPDKFRLITTGDALDAHVRAWESSARGDVPIGLILLIEGADGIREPDEVAWWHAAGVRIIGPAWAGTQYCGGSGEPGPFTARGRELLAHMAATRMVLDVSHLSDAAISEALATYDGPVIASHSNARALISQAPDDERHLRDEDIRAIVARGGIVGIVPFAAFLDAAWTPERGGVTLRHVADHIDYVCQLAGDAAHVGIGSDFDGGFGKEAAAGFESIGALGAIADTLRERGYSDADVTGILGGNWLRFMREALPRAESH